MTKFHNVQVVDLGQAVFERIVSEIELQNRAVKVGDSIHVATAILHNVDLIVSTDDDILALNGVFANQNGTRIQCLDTDDALQLL